MSGLTTWPATRIRMGLTRFSGRPSDRIGSRGRSLNRLILLDSQPVGLCSNPRRVDRGRLCKQWLQERLRSGDRVMISEIIGYEVRKEMLRAGKVRGIAWLDALGGELGLLP